MSGSSNGMKSTLEALGLSVDSVSEEQKGNTYIGPDRNGKPATAFMLDTGLATWADFEWSLDAPPTSRRTASPPH